MSPNYSKRKLALAAKLTVASLLVIIGVAALLLYRQGQGAVETPAPQAAQLRAQTVAQPAQTTDKPVISGDPSELLIPSLDIDLQVTPGVYNAKTGAWTLTTTKVQYAVMTPQPNNQAGNTFMYGHYRKGVLATLHTIQPGAKAIVKTANGKTFTYVYQSNRVVKPEDSAGIFDYQGTPILTVQTCTGAFFQNRQLFTFNLEGVS